MSVVDPIARKVVATWTVPGGGSPDMGNVTADGKELWVSGRYDDEVYVFDTATGRADASHSGRAASRTDSACGRSPGSYSLGHTGNMR